jgi:hypothetical protein
LPVYWHPPTEGPKTILPVDNSRAVDNSDRFRHLRK